jgi:formylglycine-generating enzyme required for sulfatase activity
MLPVERAAARRVLCQLVTVDGTRARRLEADLVAEDAPTAAAVATLVGSRLLVASPSEEGTVLELTHEALIASWGTLRQWLSGDAVRLAALDRLQRAASDWERLGRPTGALWGRAQMVELVATGAAEGLPPRGRERCFLAASRRTWWVRRIAAAALVLVAPLVLLGQRMKAHADLARRVASYYDSARTDRQAAEATSDRLSGLERAAFAEFDHGATAAGERLWSDALATQAALDEALTRATGTLERALLLDQGRATTQALLADLIYERALVAEEARRSRDVEDLVRQLRVYDSDGSRLARWNAPASVSFTTSPTGSAVTIERFELDAMGRRTPVVVPGPARAPFEGLTMPPGSYVFTFALRGHVEVRYPVLLRRRERFEATVPLPRTDEVPPGFVYVPAGRFLYGTREEGFRRRWLNATPMHETTTEAYLIGQNEVTFGEWIEYLEDLPPRDRARELPNGSLFPMSEVRLRRDSSGWQLILRTQSGDVLASAGSSLAYPHRDRRDRQEWRRFPVGGLSIREIMAYLRWLDRTRRVLGARLCTDREWERAARGADDRLYPHGDRLSSDDANFDETYGRDPRAFGPDEVGSHPVSNSPFLVHDLAGNAWEWVGPIGQTTLRGGSYHQDAITALAINGEPTEPTVRSLEIGFRIRAHAPRF